MLSLLRAFQIFSLRKLLEFWGQRGYSCHNFGSSPIRAFSNESGFCRLYQWFAAPSSQSMDCLSLWFGLFLRRWTGQTRGQQRPKICPWPRHILAQHFCPRTTEDRCIVRQADSTRLNVCTVFSVSGNNDNAKWQAVLGDSSGKTDVNQPLTCKCLWKW